MELRDYARAIRRRWIAILLLTVLGLVGGTAAAFLTTPMYEATARIFVSTRGTSNAVEALQGSSYTQQRIQSYVDVVSSPAVLDPVIDELGLNISAEELSREVTAAPLTDTVLMDITVRSGSPKNASEIANAVAASLGTVVVDDLEKSVGTDGALVKLSIVKRATVPQSASSPNIPLDVAVGGLLGLLAGLAFAVLRQRLDTRVHGEANVRAITDAPILGGIAYDANAAKRPLTLRTDPRSPRAEAFRSLRTNLQFIDPDASNRSYVITSSIESEGKTTTAVNVALALADSGANTILVDADLRRPKVASFLSIEGSIGLSDVLIGKVSLEDALQVSADENEKSLYVLPAGTIPPNPSELLGSKRMASLVDSLIAEFDYVIIDAPPLLPVTDGAILSKLCYGALVVCATGKTKTTQLSQALQRLTNIDSRVIGVVLNMLPARGPDNYGYYDYYYADAARK